MRKFLESRVSNLELEKREKMKIIKDHKDKLRSEIEKIEKMISSTNQKIESYSQGRLIESQKTLSDALFSLTLTPMSGYVA